MKSGKDMIKARSLTKSSEKNDSKHECICKAILKLFNTDDHSNENLCLPELCPVFNMIFQKTEAKNRELERNYLELSILPSLGTDQWTQLYLKWNFKNKIVSSKYTIYSEEIIINVYLLQQISTFKGTLSAWYLLMQILIGGRCICHRENGCSYLSYITLTL